MHHIKSINSVRLFSVNVSARKQNFKGPFTCPDSAIITTQNNTRASRYCRRHDAVRVWTVSGFHGWQSESLDQQLVLMRCRETSCIKRNHTIKTLRQQTLVDTSNNSMTDMNRICWSRPRHICSAITTESGRHADRPGVGLCWHLAQCLWV